MWIIAYDLVMAWLGTTDFSVSVLHLDGAKTFMSTWTHTTWPSHVPAWKLNHACQYMYMYIMYHRANTTTHALQLHRQHCQQFNTHTSRIQPQYTACVSSSGKLTWLCTFPCLLCTFAKCTGNKKMCLLGETPKWELFSGMQHNLFWLLKTTSEPNQQAKTCAGLFSWSDPPSKWTARGH